MLDKKTKNRIIGALRTEFKYSPVHKAALALAKIKVKVGEFKNGRDKMGTFFICAICKQHHKEVQVDHIKPIGKFNGSLDDWVFSAWCLGYDNEGQDNLQVLCKACHLKKTAQDKLNI
jgi:5-methylcytosine-specific restriction endonuclease McrA